MVGNTLVDHALGQWFSTSGTSGIMESLADSVLVVLYAFVVFPSVCWYINCKKL